MALDTHKITEKMMENKQVTDAPDQPQGTAQQNKYLFDRLAKEVIIPAFNALIDSLTSAGGADIGVSVPGVSGTTVKEVLSSMKTLIDDRYTKSQSDANLKNKTDPLIKSVKLEPQTGIWTFTKENGQTVTVDTNLEKIALDVRLDSETKEFVLTLADGTEQRVSLSSFVRFLEFVGSDEIEFSTTGNTVKAGIKSGSIAEDKLNPVLFSRLDTAVSTAESSAANAQTYAQKAQTQATNAADSAADAGIDAHNAEIWTEGGQLMSEGGTLLPEHTTGAKEYAQMAQNSAGQAASSAANADTSKNAAAESAAAAARSAEEAASAAGGGVTSFNGRGGAVKSQEGDYTAEMVGAIDQSEKGRASGVASLDADGKVIADQLPEMNYDPAGSAQTVQQALNTHAADSTAHVTDEERQAWNNKASGTHTHTAAQVGALSISGGTMTGALNMNGKALTNLPTPTNNKDAAPKDYVDSLISSKKSGLVLLEKITTSKAWVCPKGVYLIYAIICGAGGGGGSGRSEHSWSDRYSVLGYGGGGGQGGRCIAVMGIPVTPGKSYQIVIGAGGAGGSGAIREGNPGNPGGATTAFGFYAHGGNGGQAGDIGGNSPLAGSPGADSYSSYGKPGNYGGDGGIGISGTGKTNPLSPAYSAYKWYTDLLFKDWYGTGGGSGAPAPKSTTTKLGGEGAPHAGSGGSFTGDKDTETNTSLPGESGDPGFGSGGGGGAGSPSNGRNGDGGNGGSGCVIIYTIEV